MEKTKDGLPWEITLLQEKLQLSSNDGIEEYARIDKHRKITYMDVGLSISQAERPFNQRIEIQPGCTGIVF